MARQLTIITALLVSSVHITSIKLTKILEYGEFITAKPSTTHQLGELNTYFIASTTQTTALLVSSVHITSIKVTKVLEYGEFITAKPSATHQLGELNTYFIAPTHDHNRFAGEFSTYNEH